jgi:hypothetical protein
MQNPEPPDQSAGWRPTTSTYAGGALGLVVGQFIVALGNQYLPHPFSPELANAIGALCPIVIGYFFPDGGRK